MYKHALNYDPICHVRVTITSAYHSRIESLEGKRSDSRPRSSLQRHNVNVNLALGAINHLGRQLRLEVDNTNKNGEKKSDYRAQGRNNAHNTLTLWSAEMRAASSGGAIAEYCS